MGPSGSGKSHFWSLALKADNFALAKRYHRVYYCCPNEDGAFAHNSKSLQQFREIPNVEIIHEFLETENDLLSLILEEDRYYLVIFDDFFGKVFNTEAISRCYTRFASHFNLHISILVQSAFPPNAKYWSEIYRNATLFVFFQTPSDMQVLSNLGRKTFARSGPKYLLSSMAHAAQYLDRPYIVIDTGVNKVSNKSFPVRSNLFYKEENSSIPSILLYKCPTIQ